MAGAMSGPQGLSSTLRPGAASCRRCGCPRPKLDLAWIDNEPFCHPSTSTGPTCYSFETLESVAREIADEFYQGMWARLHPTIPGEVTEDTSQRRNPSE